MSRICIGLPVYNGERFIADAIDSIIAQSYREFELIILDNASTDRTQEICEVYAAKDGRVKYHRNESNIGAPQNFNRVFELAVSEYFKWAAHDDVLDPAFLEECIRVLDEQKDVVLCHAKAKIINDRGVYVSDDPYPLEQLETSSLVARYSDLIINDHSCFDVFGVMRRSALAKTPLIASYHASDRVLLSELALAGRIHIVPKVLFFSRDHESRSVKIPVHERAREWWAEPGQRREYVFPYWRIFAEHVKTVSRASIGWNNRFRCYGVVLQWLLMHWRFLGSDVRLVLRQILSPMKWSSQNQSN